MDGKHTLTTTTVELYEMLQRAIISQQIYDAAIGGEILPGLYECLYDRLRSWKSCPAPPVPSDEEEEQQQPQGYGRPQQQQHYGSAAAPMAASVPWVDGQGAVWAPPPGQPATFYLPGQGQWQQPQWQQPQQAAPMGPPFAYGPPGAPQPVWQLVAPAPPYGGVQPGY